MYTFYQDPLNQFHVHTLASHFSVISKHLTKKLKTIRQVIHHDEKEKGSYNCALRNTTVDCSFQGDHIYKTSLQFAVSQVASYSTLHQGGTPRAANMISKIRWLMKSNALVQFRKHMWTSSTWFRIWATVLRVRRRLAKHEPPFLNPVEQDAIYAACGNVQRWRL